VWFERMHFMLATKSMAQIAKVVGESYWLFMACHQQLQLVIMFLPTQLQLLVILMTCFVINILS
jgi:hypothetical protein